MKEKINWILPFTYSGYGMGLNFALIMSVTFFLGSFLLPETGKGGKSEKVNAKLKCS